MSKRKDVTLRVRIEEPLYDYIKMMSEQLGYKDISKTIRLMLKVMQFMTKSELVTPPSEKRKSNWIEFLREMEYERV